MPAYAASLPYTRSSSIGCPTDSCTWSSICSASTTSVVTFDGQTSARSSAAACSATRGASRSSPRPSTYSQPACADEPLCAEGYERTWKTPSPTANASMPAPVSTSSCSISAPSEVTSSLCSRWARTNASVTFTSACRSASSARRQSATLSESETANGSCSTGVRYVPLVAASGASAFPSRPPAARAKAHARSAASRAPSASRRRSHAKPHAPPTRTRTPIPSLSRSVTFSTRPFLVETPCARPTTARASA